MRCLPDHARDRVIGFFAEWAQDQLRSERNERNQQPHEKAEELVVAAGVEVDEEKPIGQPQLGVQLEHLYQHVALTR